MFFAREDCIVRDVSRKPASRKNVRVKKTTYLNTIECYTFSMVTTVRVSRELLQKLRERKTFDKETYEEVIWNLLEDRIELSEELKQAIKEAEAEFKAGRTVSHEQLRKELES